MPDEIEKELPVDEQDGEPDPIAAEDDLVEEDVPPAEAPDDVPPMGTPITAFSVLRDIMGGLKTRYDDKYVIEVSHETVQQAHDLLVAGDAQEAE